MKQLFAPFIGQLDAAFHEAFSARRSAQTFLLGVGACVVAVLVRARDEGASRSARRSDRRQAPPPAAAAGHDRAGAPAAGLTRTLAPPPGPRPRRIAGVSAFPRVRSAAMTTTRRPAPPTFRPGSARSAPTAPAVRARCSPSRTCPPGAMRRVTRRRARRPARPHARGHRRGRRSLPAHERRRCRSATLDGCVVACPLHEGRFDLCTGEPVQMPTTGGLDPDGVLPPDLVAGRPRPEGRPARQEGRGAPADPRPPVPLLPASGSWTAGSRSRSRLSRGASDRPGRGVELARTARSARGANAGSIATTSSGSSVTWNRSRSASAIVPPAEQRARASSRAGPPSTPCPTRTTGKWRILPVWMRVSASNSSSSVPKPPGRITNASAYFTNIDLAREEVAELDAEVDVRVERPARAAARCCSRSRARRPPGSRGWPPPSRPARRR